MNIKKYLGGWKFYLALITAFAIIIRSIPAWIYSAWGTDFGIYYSITIEFLIKKNPFYEYPAVWGSSGYGSFPMLYSIILLVHLFTGLPPQELLLKVPPVIGGLCVVPLYLIAYELTGSRKIGIISAALLAINPIHVYQTSMPYLLTVGHFFMLFSLYFFIKWLKEDKYILYLVPFSIALLLSHHLTNYIYIISITGITSLGGMYGFIQKRDVKKSFLFIVFFTITTIAYWILRVPGMKYFMTSPFHYLIPWYGTASLGIAIIIALYFISTKFHAEYRGNILNSLDSLKILKVFSISLTVSFSIFLALALIGLRGYWIPMVAIFYSIPFMLTIGFIGVGFTRLHRYPKLFHIVGGWMISIVSSLLFGLITWSSLEPWRHIEYLMEPLSIVGAIGIVTILQSKVFKKVSVRRRVKLSVENQFYTPHRLFGENTLELATPMPAGIVKSVSEPITYEERVPMGRVFQIIFVFILSFILVMSGITAFSFINKVERSTSEGVSSVVMSGINWLVENGNRNYTVATNHMLGTILEAYGFPSSFEYDYKIWNATKWTDCLDELEGLNGTYPKIGYVVITKEMYENGVFGYNNSQNPLQPPVFMGRAGYEKFHHEPFKLIFRNATADNTDWVEVYVVDWAYIDSHIPHNTNNISTKTE
ncbi:hypothetical protein AciM339_0913 [Aciduliprofundum sp. MAR08-339]|uniref:hypothetical protein n=1 Tax=Aciduliprofundum sp. (strain MAR08-339) TaxID=673860 RepID=UPI0002A478CE|nr:hypothetical protein AciM339_0913 [Aciduliprofundum sp. MAR08-339]